VKWNDICEPALVLIHFCMMTPPVDHIGCYTYVC
jgi:hypothetical protein